jgi:hypothetical protein
LCDDGYAGEICDECAEGYVEKENQCVTFCVAAGLFCNSRCSGSAAEPICECRVGYRGAECEECAPGFEQVWTYDIWNCEPTCDGSCGDLETCVALREEEQRCECVYGYHHDESGVCAWDGLLEDPEFALGCAAWRLTVYRVNPDHVVSADVSGGELRLATSHRCSSATATSDAKLPAQQTVPHAGLRFLAKGAVGAVLGVSFEDASGYRDPISDSGIVAAIGTDEWEEHVECLDPSRKMEPAVVQFGIGQIGMCSERVDDWFLVRSVSVVSDPTCE